MPRVLIKRIHLKIANPSENSSHAGLIWLSYLLCLHERSETLQNIQSQLTPAAKGVDFPNLCCGHKSQVHGTVRDDDDVNYHLRNADWHQYHQYWCRELEPAVHPTPGT